MWVLYLVTITTMALIKLRKFVINTSMNRLKYEKTSKYVSQATNTLICFDTQQVSNYNKPLKYSYLVSTFVYYLKRTVKFLKLLILNVILWGCYTLVTIKNHYKEVSTLFSFKHRRCLNVHFMVFWSSFCLLPKVFS